MQWKTLTVYVRTGLTSEYNTPILEEKTLRVGDTVIASNVLGKLFEGIVKGIYYPGDVKILPEGEQYMQRVSRHSIRRIL